MSALTKKHPIDRIAKISPVEIMKPYKVKSDNEDYTPIDDLFGDLTQHTGEPGFLLKGLRYREGLSQIEFAKQLNVSQTNLLPWKMDGVLSEKSWQGV